MSPAGQSGPMDTGRGGTASRGANPANERELIERLRGGDEVAFVELVRQYQSLLKRVARMYVHTEAVAEEVVQETWLGVVRGIEGFEGRASLKTWIVRILMNRARTRGEREGRTVPFSALETAESTCADPAVPADRFQDAADAYPGHWTVPLKRWGDDPEQWVTSNETLDFLHGAIDLLPPVQRSVVMLRDAQEWTTEEVCEALGLTEANQRVLLHRGRSKLRKALESHFQGQVAKA